MMEMCCWKLSAIASLSPKKCFQEPIEWFVCGKAWKKLYRDKNLQCCIRARLSNGNIQWRHLNWQKGLSINNAWYKWARARIDKKKNAEKNEKEVNTFPPFVYERFSFDDCQLTIGKWILYSVPFNWIEYAQDASYMPPLIRYTFANWIKNKRNTNIKLYAVCHGHGLSDSFFFGLSMSIRIGIG